MKPLDPSTTIDATPRATPFARARHVVTVLLYMLIVCGPAAGLVKRLPDATVVGAVAPQARPPLTSATWMAEKFQPTFVTWFELNLWLRGTFVYADNSVLYHAFHETKPGSPVKLGKDNILINDEDTGHYSRTEAHPRKDLDAMVARIARLQRLLQKEGRGLVPMIIPSKATIYPDMLDEKWKLPLGTPRPSDVAYTDLVAALRGEGIAFVDAREILTKRSEPRQYLYPRGARHWSFFASCLATQEALLIYSQLTQKPAVPYDCSYTVGAAPAADHQDYDLYRLMNVWGATADRSGSLAMKYADAPAHPLDLLIVGTSFGWNFLRDGDRTHAFGREHYIYYNKLIVDWPSGKMQPVVAGSTDWTNAVHKELYILDLFESYPIPEHVMMFLRDMEAHYNLP